MRAGKLNGRDTGGKPHLTVIQGGLSSAAGR